MKALLLRWVKFNAVGALGVAVQLGTLALLVSGLRVDYLVATAVSVESAVMHNFIWHERFTWAERATNSRLVRFFAFNFSNGAISLLGNIALMKLLTGVVGLNYLAANVEIAPADLMRDQPFTDWGGVVAARKLFGAELNGMLDELTEALAA